MIAFIFMVYTSCLNIKRLQGKHFVLQKSSMTYYHYEEKLRFHVVLSPQPTPAMVERISSVGGGALIIDYGLDRIISGSPDKAITSRLISNCKPSMPSPNRKFPKVLMLTKNVNIASKCLMCFLDIK